MPLFSVYNDLKNNEFDSTPAIQIYDSLHPELQTIIDYLSIKLDVLLIEGFRGFKRQRILYLRAISLYEYPNSPHNQMPSHAVDMAFYPLDKDNFARNAFFAGHVCMIADALGLNIIWGGNSRENCIHNPAPKKRTDIFHYELSHES